MDTTTRRTRKLRTIPQIKIHPDLHAELRKLADEDGRTIQYTLHALLCERFERPELLRKSMLEITAS